MQTVSKLKKWSFETHVDHCQYYQGCSVIYTPYDEVVYGVGDTMREALADAIDMLCQGEFSFDIVQLDAIEKDFVESLGADADDNIHNDCEDFDEDSHDACELQAIVEFYYSV